MLSRSVIFVYNKWVTNKNILLCLILFNYLITKKFVTQQILYGIFESKTNFLAAIYIFEISILSIPTKFNKIR